MGSLSINFKGIRMTEFIYSFIIGFLGSLFGWLIGLFVIWLARKPPCKITKNIFTDNYYRFQEIHKEKFKKLINRELKTRMKVGWELPVVINYEHAIDSTSRHCLRFSDTSLDRLREYIKNDLKFEDFTLYQDCINCRLELRG